MASPNEIVFTADLQEKLAYETKLLEAQNQKAIADYESNLADWKRNKDLYAATLSKTPVPPKPPPPMVRTFDPEKWLSLFLAFHKSVVATIGHNIQSGHFDPSPAWSEKPYVSPNDAPEAPKTPPTQPLNPVGEHIRANRFHPAKGDTRPDKDVFEPLGPGGPKFIKTVIDSPFGQYRWWEQVA